MPALSVLLLCTLAAQGPAPAAEPVDEKLVAPEESGAQRLLVLQLESESVPAEAIAILDGKVANTLSADGRWEVVTDEDLKKMVELEADRAALGCDTTECLAELAGSLGADLVIYGRVAKLDDTYHLQLNLFGASQAAAIGRREIEARSVSKLADRVPLTVRSLMGELTGEKIVLEFDDDGASLLFWGVLGGGAALGVAGALVLAVGLLAAGSGIFLFNLKTIDADTRVYGRWMAWGGTPLAVVGLLGMTGGAALAASSLLVE